MALHPKIEDKDRVSFSCRVLWYLHWRKGEKCFYCTFESNRCLVFGCRTNKQIESD